ncbi:MAG: alginate export family protein, partial [Bacteroides sp.]
MKNSNFSKQVPLIIVLALYASNITAQQEVNLDAEYRPRVEYRDGYSAPRKESQSPDVLMLQRVRLNANYRSALINARLSVQDSRVFGETNTKGDAVAKTGDAPSLFLYEAWAELVLPKGIAFRIGRQALNYDDQRLFSCSNWSNTGNAHDLALLTYRIKDFKADLGYAYNNNQSNPLTSDYDYPQTFYRNMTYLHLANQFKASGINLSAIAVCEGFQQTKEIAGQPTEYSTNYRLTYGGNIEFKRTDFPLDVYATAYGQAGKSPKGNHLNACLLALKLNYRILKPFTLTGGIDYISSDFCGLYGSNHGFNGAMDYWSASSHPNEGLIDFYLAAQYKVNDKVT